MLIASSAGSWVIIVVVMAGAIGLAVVRGKKTVCPHCGHDSGIAISRARVCPSCGRRRDKRLGKSR